MATPHIMLVDNEEDAVALNALLFKQLGYRVSYFFDGPSALSAFETLRPDAVLLDIGMPPMDGYEVCRQLRSQPGGQSTAILALTGYGRVEDLSQSYRAGFDGHLTKPVKLDGLIELMHRCMGKRGPNQP